MTENPFDDLDNEELYERWKSRKLDGYPERIEDLIVPVNDPLRLTETERGELLSRIAKANMAIYQSGAGTTPDKRIPIAVMRQLGAVMIDKNPEADEEGVTSLSPKGGSGLSESVYEYIPYSARAIHWHTDGYYNATDRQVRSLALHCVRQAAEGGENELMDHEIMYMLLRDEDPGHIRALMEPDVMIIPARVEKGKIVRPERAGPVFSVCDDGRLHMRYTHRTRSVVWKNSAPARAAVESLRKRLAEPSPYVFRGKLMPGWGLVCSNVLHTRSAFTPSASDDTSRLLYRVRFYDRVGAPDHIRGR